MTKVAYIIVGWNNKTLLKECFDSIKNQSYPQKTIIYVDNNSQDGSVDYVMSNYPEIQIIEPGRNTGFAKGNNLGIRKALSDPEVKHIVLLNTDATLDKNWTSEIVKFSSLKPKGALFQGTTLDFYNHNIIDSTHIYVSRNGQGTQGNWRYYFKSEQGPKRVFGVNAAACLITRKFLDSQPYGSQYFDERMFMYLEDIDLSFRATIMGWDNYLVPNARAYHMGSASSGKNPGFSLYMTFRNNAAVLVKNVPLPLLLRMIPKIIKGDIETIRTLNRTGRRSLAWKLIKGRVAGAFRIPLYLHKRMKLHKHKQISNDQLWHIMLRGY